MLTEVVLISLGVYLRLEMRKRREVLAGEGMASVPKMLVAAGAIVFGVNLLWGQDQPRLLG